MHLINSKNWSLNTKPIFLCFFQEFPKQPLDFAQECLLGSSKISTWTFLWIQKVTKARLLLKPRTFAWVKHFCLIQARILRGRFSEYGPRLVLKVLKLSNYKTEQNHITLWHLGEKSILVNTTSVHIKVFS